MTPRQTNTLKLFDEIFQIETEPYCGLEDKLLNIQKKLKNKFFVATNNIIAAKKISNNLKNKKSNFKSIKQKNSEGDNLHSSQIVHLSSFK